MTEALNPDLVLPLRVRGAATVAQGIRRFDLAHPQGLPLPAYTPGSHILVQAPSGVTRRYSLCGAPGEADHYTIAVKRESAGRGGSISMVDALNVGDTLHASLPRNEFELDARAPRFVFIAGGIGITPIRSMVRHLVAEGEKPFKLYYLCRDVDVTAFREELGAPEFRGKVILHHDAGDPERAFDLWPVLEKPSGAHVYCCGPQPLMDAVRDMTGHWPTSAIHFEDFAVRKVPPAANDTPFMVRVGRDGAPIEVAAGESILSALRAHGYRAPSSCESGTCGSCRMRLVAGEAEHRDLVLAEGERATNIMVCVSRAKTPELVVEPL